jgi:kynurenine formamidase
MEGIINRITILMVIAIAQIFTGCPAEEPCDISDGEIIDLTYPFSGETIFWPTEERGFEFEELHRGYTDAGFYYTANRFRTAEHGGTHLDAPIHFYEGRREAHEIPLEDLISPGIVIDVTQQAAADRDYRVRISDFQSWEQLHGRIPDGAIIIIRTGWGQYWPDRNAYLGTDKLGDDAIPALSFPGLHPEAAECLVNNRNIKAIGIDTASIDYGKSVELKSHIILARENIPIFENVAYVDQLPAIGFTIIALPMKIEGGSGGPLRIISLVR